MKPKEAMNGIDKQILDSIQGKSKRKAGEIITAMQTTPEERTARQERTIFDFQQLVEARKNRGVNKQIAIGAIPRRGGANFK